MKNGRTRGDILMEFDEIFARVQIVRVVIDEGQRARTRIECHLQRLRASGREQQQIQAPRNNRLPYRTIEGPSSSLTPRRALRNRNLSIQKVQVVRERVACSSIVASAQPLACGHVPDAGIVRFRMSDARITARASPSDAPADPLWNRNGTDDIASPHG